MKTRLFLLSMSLLLSLSINAQSFSGRATYKTHRKMDLEIDSTASNEMRKQIEEQMRRTFQKTYTLNFTKDESTYRENEKLNSPSKKPASGGGVVIMAFGGSANNNITYKNLKEVRYSNKRDLMGKLFLIKDKLPKYDWVLTGETKNIGTYTVYKATWTREEENLSISMNNGETKEEKKKEKRTTTAWYTLDIPVSNGPEEWWGLPGLILEINDGQETIVCSEIVLNPSEKIIIEEPEKGKVVTQDKYEELSRKKMREFMERNRSKDGRGIELRIGG